MKKYRIGKIPPPWEPEHIAKQYAWAETFDQKAAGMNYFWELSGPDGAWFLLFKEPHHTADDIQAAARQLYRDRDVTGINYCEVELQ